MAKKEVVQLSNESRQLLSYLNERRRYRAKKAVKNKSGVETFLKYTNNALAEIDSGLEYVVNPVIEVATNKPVSKRSMLIFLIEEMEKQKKHFTFNFVGLRWNPIAKKTSVVPWALTSSLVQDIYQYPERLKICPVCDDFFWDGQSKNISRKVCFKDECFKAEALRRVHKSRGK